MTSTAQAPLYLVIRSDLQRRIVSGDLDVGDWLPSESQLQTEYAVSQTPVRRALAELERAGLIERQQGRGSVVRSREIVATHPMVGFGTELRNRGHAVQTELLALDLVSCDDGIAEELGCLPTARIYRIRRRFLADGQPCAVFEHHLGERATMFLKDITAPQGLPSLYGFLSTVGLAPKWARESITATAVDRDLASELDVSQGASVLFRTRVAFLEDGDAIEFTRYWTRSDLYSIRIELRNVWT